MKKQILILLLVVVAGTSTYAQCAKKIVITASSTEYLNGKDELQRKTVDEATTIEYDSKGIVVSPGDHTMEGTVTSTTCDWKTPYKEGKTVIKTTLKGQNGQPMTTTITIEGKDSKIIMVAEFEEMPDLKIRLTLDKFEEQK